MRWRPIACTWLALLAAACGKDNSASVAAARISSPAAIARGRAAFVTYCAICHGQAGDGHGTRQQAFVRPPRDFTDAAWRETARPVEVFSKIRDGVPGTAMPAWRSLGDETVWDLAAFVLSVGRGQ